MSSRAVNIRERLLNIDARAPTESPRQEKYVEYRAIAQALDQLPEPQYAAIMLIALEGCAYNEAAWMLGVPIGTLRSRLFRGRETLRTLRADTSAARQ